MGVQAEVRSLREPDTVYMMPLPPPDEPVSTAVTSASPNGQRASVEESV